MPDLGDRGSGISLLTVALAEVGDRVSREQQALDGPAAWHPVTKQPGWKDSCVIRDQKIAGSEERRQRPNRGVCSGRADPIEHQESRLAPHRGVLSDKLFRETEIKRVDFH